MPPDVTTGPVARLRTVARYLAPYKGRTALLAVLLFGNVALTTINPQLLGRFIDQVLVAVAGGSVRTIAILFIAATIVNQLVVSAAGYLSADLGWRATNRLRGDLAGHCLDLDLDFHQKQPAGVLIERVDGDVGTLEDFFSSFVFGVAGNLLLVVGILVATCVADWRIGAVMLAFSLAAVFAVRRVQPLAVPHVKAFRQSKAELSGFLEEQLSATEDITSSGARPYAKRQLDRLLTAYTQRLKWESIAFRMSSSVLEVGVSVATAAVLGLGAVLLTHGSISLGTVFVGYQYANLVSMTLFRISARMDQLNGALAGLDRINELLATRRTVVDGTGTLPAGPLSVSFTDVGFAYRAGTPVLSGLSFELPAGRTLGLLGRTGGGKSTIARLLFRGYDVTAGSVRLGGVDVRDVPVEELRRRVGVVTQEVQLLHGTVRDNVTLYDAEVPDARVRDAVDQVGLGPWLAALPDGLDTVVAGGQLALSAGEGQLLAFARVFLRDPDVVILDEASSRLDPATETAVDQAVRRMLAGRTAVVIAHHLSTVARMDTIIVLEDGRIVESGDRELLAGDPASRFAAMLGGVPR
jgi:ABC-type multidrug transport system fused ATPase/permease subunit